MLHGYGQTLVGGLGDSGWGELLYQLTTSRLGESHFCKTHDSYRSNVNHSRLVDQRHLDKKVWHRIVQCEPTLRHKGHYIVSGAQNTLSRSRADQTCLVSPDFSVAGAGVSV